MINRGGKKFFPREIEEILYTHPQVLYAAIVGIPDPRLGERNCPAWCPGRETRLSWRTFLPFSETASLLTNYLSGSNSYAIPVHPDRQISSRAGARGDGAKFGAGLIMTYTQSFRGTSGASEPGIQ